MPRRSRGGLEAAVLRQLWRAEGPLSGGQIRAGFDEAERPALTTVLTVLDRLADKDLVVREGARGSVLFTAARSESEETATAMARALSGAEDRATALLQFAGELGEDDLAVLRRALKGRRR